MHLAIRIGRENRKNQNFGDRVHFYI